MELSSKQICRTCITEVLENEMLHFIYNTATENDTTTIAELLIHSIPRMQIELNDELPQSICLQCLEKLLKMADFQKMCLKSQFELLLIGATNEKSTSKDVKENILTVEDYGVYDQEESDEKNHIKSQNSEEFIKLQSNADSMDNVNSQHLADDMMEFVAMKTEDLSWEAFIEEQTNDINTMDQGERECNMLQITDEEECCENSRGSALVLMENLHRLSPFENTEVILSFKAENESINDGMEELTEGPTTKTREDTESEYTKSPWINRDHSGDEMEDSQDFIISDERSDLAFSESDNSPETIKETQKLEIPTADEAQSYEPGIDLPTSKCVCKCCAKGFKNKKSLYMHEWIRKNREAKAKRYLCPVCPMVLSSSSSLSYHTTTHSNTKKHVCDVCGAAFRTRGNLTVHKRIHSNEKPYKCNYCDMRFVQLGSMKAHQSIHTSEKTCKCKFCGESFIFQSQLFGHLRKFLGKNCHACKLCPLRFCSAKDARDHFVSHKNEDEAKRLENLAALKEEEAKLMDEHKRDTLNGKLFQCKYCDKRFKNKKYTRQHEITHILGKIFKCKYCEKSFTQNCNLTQHLQRHHNGSK